MRWKIFGIAFLCLVVILLVFYWFIPFSSSEFFIKSSNANFSLGNGSSMQFYKNMRFPEPQITYKIDDCTIQKEDDMERAFDIMQNFTILDFNSVGSNEEISITCDSKNKREGDLFIAGEGGPTNITKGGEFNVIFNGQILLIKDSNCPKPNVAIHELLHVLGFNHSQNSNNIMYPVSKCDQQIGEDTISLINDLYSLSSYPDLTFEDVSASMNGKYLNTNFTVRNYGLKDSGSFSVDIYADDKLVHSSDMDNIGIGFGSQISLSNLLVNQISVNNIELRINAEFPELDKENNKIILEIKK